MTRRWPRETARLLSPEKKCCAVHEKRNSCARDPGSWLLVGRNFNGDWTCGAAVFGDTTAAALSSASKLRVRIRRVSSMDDDDRRWWFLLVSFMYFFFFLFTVGADDDDEQQLVLLPGRTAGKRKNNNNNSGRNSSIWNICAENAQKQQYPAGEEGVRLLAGCTVRVIRGQFSYILQVQD